MTRLIPQGEAKRTNPHLHCLITDGGLTEEGDWVPLGYIPYNLLHRRWQENLLSMITNSLRNDERAQKIVAQMWCRYPNGFVAHLERNVCGNMKSLTRYLVKYVVSPPISLSRMALFIVSAKTRKLIDFMQYGIKNKGKSGQNDPTEDVTN